MIYLPVAWLLVSFRFVEFRFCFMKSLGKVGAGVKGARGLDVHEQRAVARSEQDLQRNHVAVWLDGQFIGLTGRRALREATRVALTVCEGGMGSFQDVGTEASSPAGARPGTLLFEPKWDGCRAVGIRDDMGASLWSRQVKGLTRISVGLKRHRADI